MARNITQTGVPLDDAIQDLKADLRVRPRATNDAGEVLPEGLAERMQFKSNYKVNAGGQYSHTERGVWVNVDDSKVDGFKAGDAAEYVRLTKLLYNHGQKRKSLD